MGIWCNRNLMVAPLYYSLCINERMFHKELKKLGISQQSWRPFIGSPQSQGTTHFFHKGDGKVCAIVCVKVAEESGVEIAGLLVHEAVHVWQEVRSLIGEREPSSEFEAYSIQTISQELMAQYRDQVSGAHS